MAKKLLETRLGDGGSTVFIRKGKKVNVSRLSEILSLGCSPYILKNKKGVVVYFSQEEYDKLKKEYNVQE